MLIFAPHIIRKSTYILMNLNCKKLIINSFGVLAGALLFVGCNSQKQVVLMQNAAPQEVVTTVAAEPIKVQAEDQIMVYVSCDDAEVSARLSLMAGAAKPEKRDGQITASTLAVMLPYTVTKTGNIDMPLLGSLHVAGKTRAEIAEMVAQKAVEERIAKAGSINVTVEFANLSFSVMGEVNHPGCYSITDDSVNLLKALSIAGDMTIYGVRDSVWVSRRQPDGTRKMLQVNLLTTDFMQSPAFYVQQDDIIYVQPNEMRAGQSTLNDNTFRSAGFYTSLTSVAISVATLIVTLTR